MEVKMIEVRDRSTFIPAIAILLQTNEEAERYLLRRAGYDEEEILGRGERRVLLATIQGDDNFITYDPFGWRGKSRTMPAVHMHLMKHWDKINSGDVVDVEHILGEKHLPKPSERFTAAY